MKFIRVPFSFHEPHMVLDADGGDLVPETITIHHNGREIDYVRP